VTEMLTTSVLAGAPGVKHGFFTREGGVSQGHYASLNCGFSTGDEREKVQENRNRAVAALGLPSGRLAAVQQVHSNRVVLVDDSWQQGPLTQADGLVTKRRGVALSVLGADCAPVLLADPEAGVIGAVHAGWRGALDGVTDSAIDAMLALGADPRRMVAAIGPCIAQDSYEIGPEFPEPFLAQDPANGSFFRDRHFDLPGYLMMRLRRRGVEAVAPSLGDTAADAGRFFSHRRAQHDGSGGVSGRLLSAIALEI
jgi:YfiH family protein